MKTRLLLFFVLPLLAGQSLEAAPSNPPAPVVTLTHAEVLATIEHMQVLAKQAVADSDAAKKAEQVEHQAHLDAAASATTAKAEAAKLAQIAATAAAQRDTALGQRDTARRGERRAYELLVLVVLSGLVLLAAAGAPLQTFLRAEVVEAGHLALAGIRGARLALKTAFPTFLFWL